MADTSITNVKFDDRGLIPTIVQDATTNEVIALCYVDNDTLARSLQTGEADFVNEAGSASRETYPLLDLRVNVDGKSLIVVVDRESDAPAKAKSRQFEAFDPPKQSAPEVSLVDVSSMEFGLTINKLYALISERNQKRPDGSYTSYLFNSGLDKILKKVAEETGEVIIAAKNRAPLEMVSELADLFYHLLVLMVEREVKLTDVADELTRRAATNKLGPSEDH